MRLTRAITLVAAIAALLPFALPGGAAESSPGTGGFQAEAAALGEFLARQNGIIAVELDAGNKVGLTRSQEKSLGKAIEHLRAPAATLDDTLRNLKRAAKRLGKLIGDGGANASAFHGTDSFTYTLVAVQEGLEEIADGIEDRVHVPSEFPGGSQASPVVSPTKARKKALKRLARARAHLLDPREDDRPLKRRARALLAAWKQLAKADRALTGTSASTAVVIR